MARDDQGTTLVEFALVAPVILLALVACLDMARAVNAYVTVVNASREGARYATLHTDAVPDAIRANVARRVIPLDPDPTVLSVSASYDDGSGFIAWPSTGGLPRSPGAPAAIVVRVDVSYPWQATTWLIGSFFSATGSRTFVASSSMEAIK